MKGTSLESSRPPSLPGPISAGLSVLLHALLATGALIASSHIAALPPDDTPISAQFLYPLLRPQPRPVEEHLQYIGLAGTLPTQVAARVAPAPVNELIPPGAAAAPVPEVRVIPEPLHAFSEIEVDSAATRDPSSEGPVYPAKLLEARIEGVTVAQFIVDSLGRVDQSSIRILESTHAAFTAAVRDVLPRMKYQAARIGKHPVAQLVEQRFGFRISVPVPPL
ncbi:MAG: energy transducer TonB [Gemmatimonadaceae bacterium]